MPDAVLFVQIYESRYRPSFIFNNLISSFIWSFHEIDGKRVTPSPILMYFLMYCGSSHSIAMIGSISYYIIYDNVDVVYNIYIKEQNQKENR